jgi:pimeloyl-ACP methyl ester carboxylesterase
VVLPLPPHDPGAGRCRPPGGRPDLVGFGRSDKPTEPGRLHLRPPRRLDAQLLFEQLDLRDITFFGQDWGGLIGLRLVAADPDRFARSWSATPGCPTASARPNEAFMAWQKFSRSRRLPDRRIVNGGCVTDLSPEVIAAYDAPFPDDTYKAGARIFPSLVPTSPTIRPCPTSGRLGGAGAFDKPFLCAFSDGDPVTKGGERAFIGVVPGHRGAAAHHHRGRRPLPPGGRGPAAGAGDRRLHRRTRRRLRTRHVTLGSVRHHVRIDRPADVWALAGDPARLHEWFPGIDACQVDGTGRTITPASGIFPCPRRSS